MFNGVTSPGNVTVSAHLVPSAGQADTPDVREDLNFNDPQALIAERQRLTQLPAMVRFCDEVFDGVGDPTEVRNAVVTLMLSRCGWERHGVPAPIEHSVEDARMMVLEHLSPAGKAALLQTLDVPASGDGFWGYLARSDRYFLAGWTCLAQGDADHAAGALEAAENAYRRAAEAFELAGRPTAAAEALLHAARVCTGARAATAYSDSARYLLQGGYPVAAAYRLLKAGRLFLKEGKNVLAAQAAQTASTIFMAQGQRQEAVEAMTLVIPFMAFVPKQTEPYEKSMVTPQGLNGLRMASLREKITR
ncbi:hypothetical protein [Pandoraea sputorum]|uniref:Uncharacterized protein n=1 Tax=Pandoraea sputorum TaxID=93222 RepID=A0A5E5BHW8_9BURK|nr:hypothetical protein [Pandoraea sputorum]VVE84625.1 hypothetical protein PSP31121_04845 [Pandoraea sputorum]